MRGFGQQTLWIVVVIAAFSLAGCAKKNGYAVVLEKEHIDAAPPLPTPSPGTPTPTPAPESSPVVEARDLAPDEIVVDTYVMKKTDRGTGKDPRAMHDEQWLIKVQMVEDSRRITIHSDRAHFDKTKIDDRIKVSYRQGKYTGTVWSAEIED
jgi:hypothetical protein